MRALRDVPNTELIWTPADRKAGDVLRAGESVYATLQVERVAGGLFGELVGRTAGGAWSFRNTGLVSPRIEIRALDNPTPLAVIPLSDTAHFTIAIEGSVFHWRTFHKPVYGGCWYADTDTLLMRCVIKTTWSKVETVVTLTEAGAACKAVGLLITLARYLLTG